MTLKICHLISGDLWAGAEVMMFHLLNGLKTLPDIELFVIILNRGRLLEELEKIDIPVYLIDENKRSFLEIAWMVTKIVRQQAPKILHSHRYKENILSYLISITLKKDTALISTQHGMPEYYDGYPNLTHRLKSKLNYRLLALRFDSVIAVSLDIKESLVKDYGLQERRVQIIRNGVVIPNNLQDLSVKDYFLIGSVGRFFPVKDYLFMVEVAREVITNNNKIHFALAGEGPMLGDIQTLIRKYGLEKHFTLRGFLYDTSIFYKELNVYLNTSIHEGIPMSVLEAMTYQLPVIAPKIGGLREIVTDSVNGYLLDNRNPKDYADKCLFLYENETLRRKMAYAAREKIMQEFSVQQMIENYADMYLQQIGKEFEVKLSVKVLLRMYIMKPLGNIYWWLYSYILKHPQLPVNPKSFLFICKGNICRSIFAQRLAEKMAVEKGIPEIVFDSAGLEVSKALPPPQESLVVAREFGVTLDDHRSKRISREMVESFDMVIAMEAKQLAVLKHSFRQRKDRFFLLPLFDEYSRHTQNYFSVYNIRDPFGENVTQFRACYERIEKCLAGLFKQISC